MVNKQIVIALSLNGIGYLQRSGYAMTILSVSGSNAFDVVARYVLTHYIVLAVLDGAEEHFCPCSQIVRTLNSIIRSRSSCLCRQNGHHTSVAHVLYRRSFHPDLCRSYSNRSYYSVGYRGDACIGRSPCDGLIYCIVWQYGGCQRLGVTQAQAQTALVQRYRSHHYVRNSALIQFVQLDRSLVAAC